MCAYGCYRQIECSSLFEIIEEINCLLSELDLPVLQINNQFEDIFTLIRDIERTVSYYLSPDDWIYINAI